MADPVRFARRPQGVGSERGLFGLVALFLVVSLALLLRNLWSPPPRQGVVVEVRGDVASPGTYLVDPPTARAAVEAAGGPSREVPSRPVRDGDAVVVGPAGIRVVPMSDPLLVMLPVDLNVADARDIASIPGIGLDLAERIVEDRTTYGPFRGLDGVARVDGVGGHTVATLAPFATVSGAQDAQPIDINRADRDTLQRLTGIGPALAARIEEERIAHGPFVDLDDLQRVSGIGPATVRDLREDATVEAP